MKILLIYNPNAGNHVFKNNLDSIIEKFQVKGYLVSPFRFGQGIDLNELFQRINSEDYKKVLIAGGDGTINQVLNAMLSNGINLPIGIYPAGTANDFAQNFSLTTSVDEITDIYIRENYTYADIGKINDRYFINVASLGCLVDLSQRTDSKIKSSFGGSEKKKHFWKLIQPSRTHSSLFSQRKYHVLLSVCLYNFKSCRDSLLRQKARGC